MYHAKYDIAVIGAGPSGACAAALLGRLGANVLLVDPSHPREKPCGGGVTGRALAIVDKLIGRRALASTTIRAARFFDSASGLSAIVPLSTGASPALVVASRRDFDGLLFEAAQRSGAHVLAERATDIIRERSGFRIETTGSRSIQASFVIGADGPNGLVRRRLSAPFRRDQLSIATGFFVGNETSDEIVIEMVDDPPGYIWSFPRPDHLAVGICAQADEGVSAGALRARVAAWIRATRLSASTNLTPYSWPIPSLSAIDFDAMSLAGEGWLTIGDAAGLVDPITREGIFFALQSAALAAEALSSGVPRPEQRFVDRVRTEIVDELKRAASFKSGFFRPRFRRLLLDALRSSERVRHVMADLAAGSQPYRGLKRRLLRTLEFSLAWNVAIARYSHRAPGPARLDA
jgi:geranylgeranyl reductase family protein